MVAISHHPDVVNSIILTKLQAYSGNKPSPKRHK